MRRGPAISFRGALQILGHHDRPWLDRMNGLLGGVILAAGGVPAIGALWGWVDQKNEAIGLLRGALDEVSDRIRPSHGLLRHELVVAAHTTIVLTAYFDALREELGDGYERTAITDPEKLLFAGGRYGEALVRQLYTAAAPAPSAGIGFEENTRYVQSWYHSLSTQVSDFLNGLDLGHQVNNSAATPLRAGRKYRSYYLQLASTVPEFAIWANLGEHAATRSALRRLEGLLSVVASPEPSRDLRAIVRDTNRLVLSSPVIDVGTDGYGTDVVFPAVDDIFITPRYQVAVEGYSTAGVDLDHVLARHFSTPGSTTFPLLVLGHPGAGKSLLVKVLAARLPDEGYTVVRVPLRRVDANGVITAQIQQALDLSTHGRVPWHDLVDQSADVIRVVLLDGLDELLQATTHDRAGYLQEIVEFQRVEAALGKPVAVVVTSRTLVADRVTLPTGTPVLTLEEFDEDQIRQWMEVWNSHNPPMPVEFALSQPDLARQPLLLLVLALYHADSAGPVAEDLTKAHLYERLFDTYARREVTKQADRVLHGSELDSALEQQMRRLATAALGMFNRGRQDITEADLSVDLVSLGEPVSGERLLAEFFFVHAAEAQVGTVVRAYEFLHATFGEYLVAARVVEVLLDVAEGAFGRRREHEPDDDLLFALLSHQPLAIQAPVLDFIKARVAAFEPTEQDWVARTLAVLVDGYRNRKPSKSFGDYRPLPPDNVRALAAYSANLVLLLLTVNPDDKLWPGESLDRWRSTVDLWQAGLDSQGYQAMLRSVRYDYGAALAGDLVRALDPGVMGAWEARVRGDTRQERLLRTGLAIHEFRAYQIGGATREWLSWVASWLLAVVAHPWDPDISRVWLAPPDSVSDEVRREVAGVVYSFLAQEREGWPEQFLVLTVEWLVELSPIRDRSVLRWVATRLEPDVPRWLAQALTDGVDANLSEPFTLAFIDRWYY